MAFSNYSLTPSLNTMIAGRFIGEGCPPDVVNDAIRQLMADGAALSSQLGSTVGSYSLANSKYGAVADSDGLTPGGGTDASDALFDMIEEAETAGGGVIEIPYMGTGFFEFGAK